MADDREMKDAGNILATEPEDGVCLTVDIGRVGDYEIALKAALLDEVGDAVLVHDREGDIIYGNRTAYARLGYTQEELLRLRLDDIISCDDLKAPPLRAVAAAEKRPPGEFFCRRRDGTYFPVEVNSRRLSIEGQTYTLSVFRDISWRKSAEAQLKRLWAAVEQSTSIVVLTDLEANIVYVNPAFTRATGYSLEEVRGQNPRILKSGRISQEEYRRMWEVLLREGQWRGEFYNKRKDGSCYWEYAIITVVRDQAGRPMNYMAVKEDITLRKALEEEREAIIAELQQALENIRTLKGLIPVCAGCKRIRNDSGYWQQVDEYLRQNTDSEISHGLCEECARRLYPDLYKDR